MAHVQAGKITVVAGPPTLEYGRINSPLEGRNGRLLLKYLGVPKERINAIRTRQDPASASESPVQAKARFRDSEPRFRRELSDALRESKWILCLGAEAFTAVSGKRKFFNWIGAPLQLDEGGATCFPTFNPGFLRTKGGVSYANLFETHVRRFAALFGGELPSWTWPPLYVENDSDALANIEAIASSDEPVGVDIETDGITLEADLICIGFAICSAAVSLTVPFASKDLETAARRILSQVHRKKVWQNGSFDRYTLQHKGFEVGGDHEDTLLMHSILEPHHKHTLGFIASSYFHAPAWKAEHESESELVKSVSRFSRADSEKFRNTRIYNAKDALMQRLLHDELSSRLTAL